MFFRRIKKSQAAAEFLLNYGWMLIVVLIIGALILSFVDFKSMLPSYMNMGDYLRGYPQDSIAYSFNGLTARENEVDVVFKYIGSFTSMINYTGGIIETEIGENCYSYRIKNIDTGQMAGCFDNTPGACDKLTAIAEEGNSAVVFVSGHVGVLTFICSTAGPGVPTPTSVDDDVRGTLTPNIIRGLLEEDVLNGVIEVHVINPKTDLTLISKGDVRLPIS